MLLYITQVYPAGGSIGIWKKVLGQVKALKIFFSDVYVVARNNQVNYLYDEENIIEKEMALTKKDSYECIQKWIENYNINKTYIRYPMANKWFIKFLQWQKEEKIKSILEIPTFPYDEELPYGRLKVEDQIYRQLISGYIDIVTTYSEDKSIWNIPTITLINGTDVEPHFVKKKKGNNTILIASSSMAFWHGYERLIEGLKLYYLNGGTGVYIWFVGTGSEEKVYKKMTSAYSLNEYIKFWGMQTGESLNKLYDQADIAIGCLGLFKRKSSIACPIKVAEYCAFGLPIVNGHKDSRFSKDIPFILQIPNDSSPVDINKILDFYRNLQKDESYAVKIRKYAEDNLSWDSVMRPVAEYFKSS